jgi:hypothetical protein
MTTNLADEAPVRRDLEMVLRRAYPDASVITLGFAAAQALAVMNGTVKPVGVGSVQVQIVDQQPDTLLDAGPVVRLSARFSPAHGQRAPDEVEVTWEGGGYPDGPLFGALIAAIAEVPWAGARVPAAAEIRAADPALPDEVNLGARRRLPPEASEELRPRPRSCPTCHSIMGVAQNGCQDLWHVEVRPKPVSARDVSWKPGFEYHANTPSAG